MEDTKIKKFGGVFGLSKAEAAARLKIYGENKLPVLRQPWWRRTIMWFISPTALMLFSADALSYVLGKIFDVYFILALIGLNFFISKWQEHKADRAVNKLQAKLNFKAQAFRDNSLVQVFTRQLVPGDCVKLGVGDIVPADGRVLKADNFWVNESAVTGESLPQEKSVAAGLFSGTFVTAGQAVAEITATGAKTMFGKTLLTIEKPKKRSLLEQDILGISKFLMGVSLVGVAVLSAALFFRQQPVADILILDLSLVIAGVPISLPTVMTLIISLGALQLAEKQAIVRRLSSLEDLANVNLLLTDKTGTLTKNEIRIARIYTFEPFSEAEVLEKAVLVASFEPRDPINRAVLSAAQRLNVESRLAPINFTPADSERKHASAEGRRGGENFLVVVGAPQAVTPLCRMTRRRAADFEQQVAEAAGRGFRVLAVAVKGNGKLEEQNMTPAGLLFLADPLAEDSAEVLKFLASNGIEAKVLTGDNHAISERIGRELGLSGKVVTRADLESRPPDMQTLRQSSVFSEILPKDKYEIVRAAGKEYHVAVTGDGVNDFPAMEAADISIAVKNSVDALKNSADIVMLAPGISIIRDALVESRKIFVRLYNYSVYRISESFRLILSIIILGLLYDSFPLTPVQLILIALLNDIPIVSLAFDRVKYLARPAKIDVAGRLTLSILFGFTGLLNSLLLFFLLRDGLHAAPTVVQTAFFLKLTVSGHMLIYVAHTKERWFKFLPSSGVILATSLTQLVATIFAWKGIFMDPIPLWLILFIWAWSFIWMQISELTKILRVRFSPSREESRVG
ncbi:MAG: HAD-IC family P-type ATPase [Patescibacteria group bacterium]|nr:HAD-IC family P-type ATPase [Patescibacteria group bacterium]